MSFRAKYKAAIHRVIYRLLADHYGNRMDLESALGGDLIDTIWQTPYERLRPREQERFDRVIDGIIERIGTDKTFQVVILDSRLRVEEIIELTHAWRWMEMVKEGRITEDQDLVESEEESREDEAIMLLSECKIALEFLKINSGFPFPGVIVNLEEKLQEYFKFPEDEAGSKGAQDQLPQADAQQPGTDSVVAKTTSQELNEEYSVTVIADCESELHREKDKGKEKFRVSNTVGIGWHKSANGLQEYTDLPAGFSITIIQSNA